MKSVHYLKNSVVDIDRRELVVGDKVVVLTDNKIDTSITVSAILPNGQVKLSDGRTFEGSDLEHAYSVKNSNDDIKGLIGKALEILGDAHRLMMSRPDTQNTIHSLENAMSTVAHLLPLIK